MYIMWKAITVVSQHIRSTLNSIISIVAVVVVWTTSDINDLILPLELRFVVVIEIKVNAG